MMDLREYISIFATSGLLYVVGVVIYRLFFHPLARVPGPKLAAATQWYEALWDFLKSPGATYWVEIERMHDRYGKYPSLRY